MKMKMKMKILLYIIIIELFLLELLFLLTVWNEKRNLWRVFRRDERRRKSRGTEREVKMRSDFDYFWNNMKRI